MLAHAPRQPGSWLTWDVGQKKMTLPEFDIYPYVGALPVRFGAARDDMPHYVSSTAKPGKKNEDWFGSVRVAYSDEGKVVELGFEKMAIPKAASIYRDRSLSAVIIMKSGASNSDLLEDDETVEFERIAIVGE